MYNRSIRKKKSNAVLYGTLAGVGLLVFYLVVLSFFQGFGFAFLNLRRLWYLIFPLIIGFGTQVGLFFSIKHNTQMTATVASTGGVSGGSMVVCCSHFILNLLPLTGISGLAIFLMQYQKAFLGLGIISNIIGITFILNHKRKMRGVLI